MSTAPPPRIQEFLQTTPPVTQSVVSLCALLYGVVQVLGHVPLSWLTLSPRRIWYQGQVYRILTSALFHHNFLHLAMNAMSTLALGSPLERHIGSLRLLSTIGFSIVVTRVFYVVAALFLSRVFSDESWMNQEAIGFSGVLFHLSILECNLGASSSSRSLFGMVDVPSYLYPWILLIVLQILIPNLSFLGHLSGILAGTCQLYGVWNGVLPSESFLARLENHAALRCLTSHPSFVTSSSSGAYSTRALPAFLRRGVAVVSAPLRTWTLRWRRGIPSVNDEDDDDWNGLPPLIRGESSDDTTSLLV